MVCVLYAGSGGGLVRSERLGGAFSIYFCTDGWFPRARGHLSLSVCIETQNMYKRHYSLGGSSVGCNGQPKHKRTRHPAIPMGTFDGSGTEDGWIGVMAIPAKNSDSNHFHSDMRMHSCVCCVLVRVGQLLWAGEREASAALFDMMCFCTADDVMY